MRGNRQSIIALVSEAASGSPYKVGRVVHGWGGVVGLAVAEVVHTAQVILGSRRGPEGQAPLYVKCLFFYTQRPLAFTQRAFL